MKAKKQKSIPRFVTNLRISRIFLCLLVLGLIKLGLITGIGMDALTHKVASGVVQTVRQTAVSDAVAATEANAATEAVAATNAMAQPAAQPDAQPAQTPAAQEETPPPGVDKLDWKALKERERELVARERSLQALEKSLDQKLKELDERNAQLKAMLDEAKGLKDKRVKHLVDVYSNMKAKNAAAVLETLDEQLAVKILAGMRGRQAGEILGFVTPEKAAKLSEDLTRLRAPFQQEN